MDGCAGRSIVSSTCMVTVATITLLVTSLILVNGAKQALFKRPNEPLVVFHWLPFVGSAISYGQEPIKFLDDCQAKVKNQTIALTMVEIHPMSSTDYSEVW